ncbi:MAG: pyrimidine 5'-nucleotidase [Minwuia sp.]|uniref:pyrimidine 5'-nucleotidase n=1 Tax=Minwuia sp. TaxID=2493630 RepID=UPI003A8A8BFD
MPDPATRRPDLRHIDTWVFDLDNTLYPASSDLFAQVSDRMRYFIRDLLEVSEDEAHRMQKGYFMSHGTTLKGLMDHHGIDPHDFLDYVHQIDLSPIPPNPELPGLLERLPGRRLVFTNGSVNHALNIMTHLGIEKCFEGIFDIVHSEFEPKKSVEPYRLFIQKHEVDPARAVMFEDMARNLAPAHEVGFTTVWIPGISEWSFEASEGEHINYITEDLNDFLIRALDVIEGRADPEEER